MCVEATAEYYMSHPHIAVSYPEIVKWDKDGIVATESSGVCMSSTIIINFADQTISVTYSPKVLATEQRNACSSLLGPQKSGTLLFVLKGSERWEKEHWQGIIPEKQRVK